MAALARHLRRLILLDIIATVVLSPVLVVQALLLRKRVLRLPEASGPRHAITGAGPRLRLLLVGDSSAAGVGTATQDTALAGQIANALSPHHTVTWHLIAETGATTSSTLTRLRQETLPLCDVVIVVLGVNDVTRGGPRALWMRTHAALRAMLRCKTGARHLYITQVPPLGAFPLLPQPLRWLLGRRATRFDAALCGALRNEPECTYVPLPPTLNSRDMAEDGFHPGPVIYTAWAYEMAHRILTDGPFR